MKNRHLSVRDKDAFSRAAPDDLVPIQSFLSLHSGLIVGSADSCQKYRQVLNSRYIRVKISSGFRHNNLLLQLDCDGQTG